MDVITVKDKQFQIAITAEAIDQQVDRIAAEINRDFEGKEPLFLVVLNGAIIFAGDLLKKVTIPCEVSSIKLASYVGMKTTGSVTQLLGLAENVKGRSIIVVEDIVDTGTTMFGLLNQLSEMGALETSVVTLFHKFEATVNEVPLRYVGFRIKNRFIVGYGLDYDGYGRNYPAIYEACEK